MENRLIGGQMYTWIGTDQNGQYVPISAPESSMVMSDIDRAKQQIAQQFQQRVYTEAEKARMPQEQQLSIWSQYSPELQAALSAAVGTPQAPTQSPQGGMMGGGFVSPFQALQLFQTSQIQPSIAGKLGLFDFIGKK